jgi:hypothetical protein
VEQEDNARRAHCPAPSQGPRAPGEPSSSREALCAAVTAGPSPGTSADQEVAAFDTDHPAAAHATDWVLARCGTARGWFSLSRYRLGVVLLAAQWVCEWQQAGEGAWPEQQEIQAEVLMPGKPPVKLGVYLERQDLF